MNSQPSKSLRFSKNSLNTNWHNEAEGVRQEPFLGIGMVHDRHVAIRANDHGNLVAVAQYFTAVQLNLSIDSIRQGPLTSLPASTAYTVWNSFDIAPSTPRCEWISFGLPFP